MSSYSYVAVDPQGAEMRGTIDVPDQGEALRRIRELGLFPTKVLGSGARKPHPARVRRVPGPAKLRMPWYRRGTSSAALAVFTRQLAMLMEAGMPLLRGLRTLEEQVENKNLKCVIGEMAVAIESGCSLGEAVGMHPRIFNHLFVNMVKAGELSGALETTLRRLAEFMEKARKIKGKVKAAMFYPCAVLFVAAGILVLLMVFIVPRFRLVFEGLWGAGPCPALRCW